MRLSIVVIVHNMRREAPRTLLSLSPDHQGLDPDRYEILVVENGSDRPLAPGDITAAAPNARYLSYPASTASPAAAVNFGIANARHEAVAVIVDGARMASPGLVGATLSALDLAPEPVVFSRAWHLGPAVQNLSMLQGYDQDAEDQLLTEAGWPAEGYALFDISTLAQSSGQGLLGGAPSEFSWFAMRRRLFDAVGGFDPRFTSPGGGLVNQHFRNQVLARPGVQPIALLGEGVFHQFHGGVATNVEMRHHPFRSFAEEYSRIVGTPFTGSTYDDLIFYGRLSPGARKFL